MENKPRVSVGLPVYNGENYLESAIDSVLSQTYKNFELIISDNASTDRTRQICEAYQKKDDRIYYFRHEKNLGAARNYNFTVNKSRGEYFVWLAHDDLMGDEYIAKCIEVLDKDKAVVLCFSDTVFIDSDGEFLKNYKYKLKVDSNEINARFIDLVSSMHIIVEVFGLMRADVLKRTPMIASFMASDRVLLGELLLYGRFHKLKEPLFFHREHLGRSVKCNPHPKDRENWFDSRRKPAMVFPEWRRFYKHFVSVTRVPLGFKERVRLAMIILRVMYWQKEILFKEFVSVFNKST